MQASLAGLGLVSGLLAWSIFRDGLLLAATLLLGAVIPFTLVVIFPTNRRLQDPALDPDSAEATALLGRWGRLHAVRTIASLVAFALLLARLVR